MILHGRLDLPGVGRHVLVLQRVEQIPSPLDPTRWALAFEFSDGDVEISKVTGTWRRVGGSLEKFLEQLNGHPIAHDVAVDLDEFVGRDFEVDVEAKEPRGVRIRTVRPAAVAAA